jgi:hypothetical protein
VLTVFNIITPITQVASTSETSVNINEVTRRKIQKDSAIFGTGDLTHGAQGQIQ